MARLWLFSLLWVVCAAAGHLAVRHWGMWWAFGSAGALTVALWVWGLRTVAAVWAYHPPIRPVPARSGRTRRIVIEEHTW